MFKVRDRVKCINNYQGFGLKLHKVYTIKKVLTYSNYIKVEDSTLPDWFIPRASRFILVNKIKYNTKSKCIYLIRQ